MAYRKMSTCLNDAQTRRSFAKTVLYTCQFFLQRATQSSKLHVSYECTNVCDLHAIFVDKYKKIN